MRAAVAYEKGQPLVIEELPTPMIGSRDVLVSIAASGICHTDLHIIEGKSAIPIPIIPGHEACGTVEAVGDDVRRVKKGDRVLAAVTPACGACWSCLHGMSNKCDRRAVLYQPRFALPDGRMAPAACGCGTFAESMVVDEATVVAVQTDLPDEQLCLLGCGVSTGLGAAFNVAKIEPGSSVAVIGCGGVGQSVIQGARISGASRIFAIDLNAGRREASRVAGATDLIDPAAGDPVEQVRALSAGGRGVDFAFEAVGFPELMLQAWGMAREGGSVVVLGMPPQDAVFSLGALDLVFSSKRLVGASMGGTQILRDFPRYLELAHSGQLDLGSMVSHEITLDQINEGIDLLNRADGTRVVIR